MSSLSKKIILLGDFSVGKTSLINRFVHNQFVADYHTTIGVKILKKEVEISDNLTVKLIIWDIAGGQLNYRTPLSYYLGAEAMVYVFDVSKVNSVAKLNAEIQTFRSKYSNAYHLTIGNKTDKIGSNERILIESQVPTINYFTSAKTGENVDKLFEDVAENILELV